MTGRLPTTLLAILGALLAAISAQVGASPLASMGWAIAAGVGLTLMLRGVGLRIVGVLIAVLGVTGAGWAVQAGAWVAGGGFVLCIVAAGGFIVWGPGWHARRSPRAAAPADLWKVMDEGGDPTAEQGSPRQGDTG